MQPFTERDDEYDCSPLPSAMNPEGAKRGCGTPTHPPYAKMIAAAIEFLAEEGGSTEEAISKYILAHYDGLSWAHDRLLPYYLSRLTDLKHLVAGAPGRYLTAYSDDAQIALEPASTGFGVPFAGPPPAELSPGPGGTPPGASSNCSSASETGSTMSIPEHVATTTGGSVGQEAEHSLPLLDFSESQANDGIQQDASSVHKRRGRPPKRVANAELEPVQAPAREDVHPLLGRPPKKVTELNMTEENGEHGPNPIRPLPVLDNGASSPHICSPPSPPPQPTFRRGLDVLDYVLALPNQGPVTSAAIKEDPPSVEGLKVASGAEGMSVSSNGEAKNETDEPARPSMATSDHPLHTAMIPAAIQNLSEDTGSTEAAMSSECMVANSDRLFPLCLHDLANTEEELVATARSLYMPAYNDNRLTPPGSMAGDPGRCIATDGQYWLHAMAPGPSTAELSPGGAPGTSKPSPDSETGSTMSLVVPVVAAVTVDAFVQPPQSFAFPEPESNGVKQQLGGEEPCPARKRRGRPPKRKINDTDLARDSREITNNAPPAAPGNGGAGSDPLVRRPRGRPRKKPITDAGSNSSDAQHGSGWSIQAQAPAYVECYAPMSSSEPAESPPAKAPPSEDWVTDNAFLLALLEGTTMEFDASIRERLECVLTMPSTEPVRSSDGEPPHPAWGDGLMAASGSFGTEAMGWGVAGDKAEVPQGRGRGRPPKGQRRRGRPRKSQF